MNSFKQRKTGRVVSTQMKNTAVVSVDAYVSHPLYQKKIRKTRRFLAHNPENKANLGDTVTIEEIKPMSKRKHWMIADIKPTTESMEEVKEEQIV
ncbi:MAG: 30S ribosomal protein S17 [Patescibacteria group bacterium]|nr:30S ribosomal protein S17 [Patescibacteria group bacterium]